MSVCAFNFSTNGEYTNLFNAAAFSRKSFIVKIYLPVNNLYLPMFPDDKAEILAVCLLNYIKYLLCFARFCYRLL